MPTIRYLLLLLLFACNAPRESTLKSPLVQRLEGIFYQEDFARVPQRTFRANDYGAIGDGQTLTTAALQETIDTAAAAGGGIVMLDPGTYLSGALFIKSNVNLHLDEGVTIKAIQDDRYFPDRPTRVAGIEMDWPAALINVYEQQNVRITGKGTLDGSGKYWWDKFWGDPPRSGGMWTDYTERGIRWAVDYDCKRVRPVVVYKSSDVLLQDFRVRQAGFWTISLTYSERVYVNGLVIRNNIDGYGPSSDGINSDSSSDILVENCDIDCNDDNLCIKAGRDFDGLRVNRPAENIVYRNCITRAGHGLFTIGSETSGGMRNIEVYGLEAIGTNIGIRFKSAKVRGGLIENVWFHDIKMSEVNYPFHFELNWYPEYSYPEIPPEIPESERPAHWQTMTRPVLPPEKGIPEFRDIRLSDIQVEKAEQAMYVNAFPEKPIRNLQWENIRIAAASGGSIAYARDWTMNNVLISTADPKPISMEGCENVASPTYTQLAGEAETQARSVEAQLDSLQKTGSRQPIVPFLAEQQILLQPGDTTRYSEDMRVYLFPGVETQFRYFEPLGDGFYVSPVDLSLDAAGTRIELEGEVNHLWTFYLKTEQKPRNVAGADHWEYNAEEQFLVIEKTGMRFDLQLE